MEAAIIIGSVILFVTTLAGLYVFDIKSRENFQYTFIFSKPKLFSLLIAAALFALSFYGTNNEWTTSNVVVCAITGGIIFLVHAYFNYTKTNLIYGTIGTLLQVIVTAIVGYFTLLFVVFFFVIMLAFGMMKNQSEAIKYS